MKKSLLLIIALAHVNLMAADYKDTEILKELVPVKRTVDISKRACHSSWNGYGCRVNLEGASMFISSQPTQHSFSKTIKISMTEKITYNLKVFATYYEVSAYGGSLGRATIKRYLDTALSSMPDNFEFTGIVLK